MVKMYGILWDTGRTVPLKVPKTKIEQTVPMGSLEVEFSWGGRRVRLLARGRTGSRTLQMSLYYYSIGIYIYNIHVIYT